MDRATGHILPCPLILQIFVVIGIFREQKDGEWHERTNSVVISEQETKMEGVQHVYNKKDNIDAALVCEDRLREHT